MAAPGLAAGRRGHPQLAFHLIFLAHHAWLMGDAITRTLVRLVVTRRPMLQWVTAARAKARFGRRAGGEYRRMYGAVVPPLAVGILVALVAPFALAVRRGVRGGVAPLARRGPLDESSRAPSIGRSARRRRGPDASGDGAPDLAFFETTVGPTDHHLPPDNLQEDPARALAHRTSPTNVGLYLLATLAARDFGWIGTVEVVERLERTLQSLARLERVRGHFYNWYETRDLRKP